MCLKPQSVRNPLYKRTAYVSEFGKIKIVSPDFSPSGEYIEVPCGKCAECRDAYFNSLLQRAICESRSSYMYFVTLTYDDAHIPFIDLDGERILYADYSHIQDMVKRFRASNLLDRDFRYLVVNEYGDAFSRPHFHLLFFVSKKNDDDRLTPLRIERVLYDNLKRFYAMNIGTRKHPIYEPLFTYCERVTPFGLRCNYWVKYVEPGTDDYLIDENESCDIRAIRYLIGYVNVSSRVDGSISEFLSKHSHDELLCKKVRNLLSNKVRFSKGFGCGFINGVKYYLPKISVRASSNVLTYSELVDNFPITADDFELQYPDLYEQVLEWISDDVYRKHPTLADCLKSFTVDDFYMHCLALRYFPRSLSNHIRDVYKDAFVPTISSYFDLFSAYRYTYKRVATQSPEDTDLFRYLRRGVDDGISHSVPFLAFPIKSQNGYVVLCKYYRDRVCTFDDIRNMYNSIGVSNYDEWRELFIKSYNTRKVDKCAGNLFRNKEFSEVILQKQKKSLYLRRKFGVDAYSTLFVH